MQIRRFMERLAESVSTTTQFASPFGYAQPRRDRRPVRR